MVYQNVQGEDVPALGFGTWRLTGDACRKGVAHALALGYRHIDTAEAYGNEEAVGRGMRDAGVDRAAIFLTTQVWHENLAPQDVRRAAEASLRKRYFVPPRTTFESLC